jgi:hypothetical protein
VNLCDSSWWQGLLGQRLVQAGLQLMEVVKGAAGVDVMALHSFDGIVLAVLVLTVPQILKELGWLVG